MKLFGAKETDSRPVLYVVEPFNFLLTNWHQARILDATPKTDEALGLFAAGHTDAHHPLASLVRSPLRPVKADLLETTALPLLGERRVFKQDRKTTSVVLGLSAETKGMLDAAKPTDAEQHGLLALSIGYRSVSQVSASNNSLHQSIGTILYEPTVQPWPLPTDAPVLFLSLLSPDLLTHFWSRYFPDRTVEATTAADILSASPTQAEWLLHKTNVIGSASLRDRYQLLNLLDKHYRCRLFSKTVADKQLTETYQF